MGAGGLDPVTGLPRTGQLLAELDARCAARGGAGEPFTLALVNIVGLRVVNRELGDEAGDDLLRQVAGRLAAEGRALMVARVGGDEFALLKDGAEEGGQWVRWLHRVLHPAYRLDGRSVSVQFHANRRVGPSPRNRCTLWLLQRDMFADRTRGLQQQLDALTRDLQAIAGAPGGIAGLRAELERYQDLARRDPATRLLNHRGLEEREAELTPPFCVAFVDLDDLHDINSHGDLWEEGNRAIQAVADLLSDAFGADNVARWGGDEDLVLAPGMSAEQCAERLRGLLEQCRTEVRVTAGPVTFSAGVASCLDGYIDAARRRAQRAVALAKRTKGTVLLADG